MSNYCLMFPGQGSQYVGMGKSFFASEDKYSIQDLMLSGPMEELTKTSNAQQAILLHSVLAFWELKKRRPDIKITAALGHSLGEYSALVCAGVLTLEDALSTVKLRGELMQKAVPLGDGAMAAILGLDINIIEKTLRQFADPKSPNYVAIANLNGFAQTVISGKKDGVENAMALLKELGAKRCLLLPVSAPFHSLLMKPAEERLAIYLKDIVFKDPEFPIISTSKPSILNDAVIIKEILLQQITSPVYFASCIELAKEKKVVGDGFLEVGPGQVLSGLVKRINCDTLVKNVDQIEDIANV